MTDTDFIAYAEGVCFSRPWTAGDIAACTESMDGVCAVDEGVGYAFGRISFDEAELYRIAVLPDKRGRGAGSALLARFIQKCTERGAVKIFLEVRSENVPAVKLYEKHGFRHISTRRGYYGDDDALIYEYPAAED